MKYLELENTRYDLVVNCGQSINNSSELSKRKLSYPELEVICCLSKDTPLHFSGTPVTKIRSVQGPEDDCPLLF